MKPIRQWNVATVAGVLAGVVLTLGLLLVTGCSGTKETAVQSTTTTTTTTAPPTTTTAPPTTTTAQPPPTLAERLAEWDICAVEFELSDGASIRAPFDRERAGVESEYEGNLDWLAETKREVILGGLDAAPSVESYESFLRAVGILEADRMKEFERTRERAHESIDLKELDRYQNRLKRACDIRPTG